MRRSLHQAVLAALPVALAPAMARGVIFYSTGDTTYNTTAPTGALATAGWQYEFGWRGGFTATPVAPHYFITAAHIDPAASLNNQFWYQDLNYKNVAFSDGTRSKDYGDLRLYRTDETFYSFAPLYNQATDGLETSQPAALIVGRGTQRGNPITANSELKGWDWGPDDFIQRWGQNKVGAIVSGSHTNDQLKFFFDRTGMGDSASDEVHVSRGDSGGGIFINVNGQWKVAGVTFSLDQYRLTAGGANISAALYDTGGLFKTDGSPISDDATDHPSGWYASRVSAALSTFTPWLDLNPTWNVNASGLWGTSANWSNNTNPRGVDSSADFRTVITAARTVSLGTPQTVGKINFDNVNRYTLTGSMLTIDVSSGSGEINVGSGSHTITSPITLNDSLTFRIFNNSSILTLSGALNASGKAITKEGQGKVELNNIRAGSLTVNQGRVLLLANGTTAGTSKVNSLVINNASQLNVADNSFIVDYTGASPLGTWDGSAYTGLMHNMVTAYNSGVWNAGGIASSAVGENGGFYTLGIAEASQALRLTGGQTRIWAGQTVDATSVLIKFTYAGDANLDGRINIDDYTLIDYNISIHSTGYFNGDLNYDGRIDIDDYSIIDYNISRQGAPFLSSDVPDGGAGLSSISTVPEPAGLATIAGGLFFATRRRRCRSGTR